MRRVDVGVLLVPALLVPSTAQAFTARVPVALNCPKTVSVTVGDSGSRLFFRRRR